MLRTFDFQPGMRRRLERLGIPTNGLLTGEGLEEVNVIIIANSYSELRLEIDAI